MCSSQLIGQLINQRVYRRTLVNCNWLSIEFELTTIIVVELESVKNGQTCSKISHPKMKFTGVEEFCFSLARNCRFLSFSLEKKIKALTW